MAPLHLENISLKQTYHIYIGKETVCAVCLSVINDVMEMYSLSEKITQLRKYQRSIWGANTVFV